MRVVVAAGVGGHSGYALSVGYHLARRGVEVWFLAPRVGWVVGRLSRLGRVLLVEMPRRPQEPLLGSLPKWPRALAEALGAVDGGFDALVACGSNYSLAPAVAARLRGVPVYNVESSVRLLEPSRAAWLIDRLGLARRTLLQWPEQRRFYGRRGVVVGPLYEPRLYEPRDEGYVLVTAGSMGHPLLFRAVLELPLERVVVQTGRVDPRPLAARRPGWVFLRYTSDLHRLIAGASAVIAHFPGMTGMTASLAYGKPVVLVPAPHLRVSARLENAPLYARRIGAVYVPRITPRALMEALEEARRLGKPRYRPGGEVAAELIIRDARRGGV